MCVWPPEGPLSLGQSLSRSISNFSAAVRLSLDHARHADAGAVVKDALIAVHWPVLDHGAFIIFFFVVCVVGKWPDPSYSGYLGKRMDYSETQWDELEDMD
ncbi:hypothetical protein CDAR_440811 [Caerostris darwini]|uniref:Uncharacterized protein n=1 Tax=Caerostris darwini TaxID=1538125 RepID=A0AAV4MMK2_9ARAC|nr:hypothetical protein CDAR_440811 [Caerostris darwini]